MLVFDIEKHDIQIVCQYLTDAKIDFAIVKSLKSSCYSVQLSKDSAIEFLLDMWQYVA